VLNILEKLDTKFPSVFPSTNWDQYIIKKQQVTYKMKYQSYQIAGEGVYGTVFRCNIKISGNTEEAVIKFLRKMNTRGAKALREAKLMELLRDKCGDFVPRFLGVAYVKPDETYVRWGLVCEDVNDNSFGLYGNTLHGACELHTELLRKMKEGNCRMPLPVPKLDWLYIIRDCAIGLAYIHKAGVILNDLKATNLLLKRFETPKNGSNWRVTFIDFGLASYGPRGEAFNKSDVEYWRSKCWHIAPEVFNGCLAPEVFNGCLSTCKSDVYSFGVLVKPIVQMFKLVRYKPLCMTCIRDNPMVRPTSAVLANELNVLAWTEPKEEPPPSPH
jgi:serine/threonine protein kinase